MKGRGYLFLALGVSLLSLSSCYSPKFMVDDDVYIVKSNDLPVGESLNDQTSYAGFKRNKSNNAVSSSFYDDELFMTRRDFHREHWMYGMAYGFYYYNTPFGVHPSLFYSPFNYGYMNPYYMYDPFGSPYGYYSSFYDPFYYGNGYYTYGYGYGNGYNYQNSNYGNPYQGSYTVLSNHHSGPRGSTSGFGNPNGRLQGNVLKTVQNPNPSSASNANFEGLRPTTQKALDRSKIIGEEVRGANNIALKPANTINSPTRQYRSTVDRGINYPSNTANSFNHNTNTQPVHHNAGNGGGRIDNMSGPRGSGSTNGGGNSGSGRSGGGSPSGGTRRH